MSWIDSAIRFFTDRGNKISHKAAVIITVLAGVFILDNFFNFSYHYRIKNKLNEISQVNELLKDEKLDSAAKIYLLKIQKEIINKRSIPDYLSDLFRKKERVPNKTMHTPTENIKDSNNVNTFLYLLSTIGLIIIFLFPLSIRQSFFDKQDSLLQRIGLFIAINSFMLVVSAGLLYLFDLIPKISPRTWTWNYILNAFIQITIFTITIVASTKEEE